MKKTVVAIDMGGTHIRAALFEDGKIVVRKKIKTKSEEGVSAVIDRIVSLVHDCEHHVNAEQCSIASVGTGVPGPVDFARGVVHDCPNMPGWHDIAVASMLEKRLSMPIIVENDARVAALGEQYYGAGKGLHHFFYVTVGTGIGGAIIAGGQLYRGADGAAGEFGMTHTVDGELFERTVAGPAIKRLFGISTEDIPSRYRMGDSQARKALNYLVERLGIWLANVTTLLNPQKIIVGGGVSELGDDLFIRPLESVVKTHAFSVSAERVVVERAGLGDDAGLYGAAFLAQRSLDR